HGFQTLEDDSDVLYLMGHAYVPGAGRGVRFDDPAFAIAWPPPPPDGRTVSAKDRGYPDFVP
ncbi:MAG: dTDP-4-dehydrorhamnose 3,5-epimerase, partial [Actinobacteria bacterium]|nr:dTDP-4-dehydrorhamnose 3,5-epimerase [Actinomycetota bacterium]